MRGGRAFTAWCLYTWDSMQSFYFRQKSLFPSPPESALADISVDRAWYGKIWVKYPLDNTLMPTRFGHVIHATVELRYILHNFANIFFGTQTQGQPVGTASLEQLLHFRTQINHWFHSLPDPLTTDNIVFPGYVRIHTEYYTTLLTLVQAQSSPTPLRSTPETTPGFSRVNRQRYYHPGYTRIETLVRLYYPRHNCEFYDPFSMLFSCSWLGIARWMSSNKDEVACFLIFPPTPNTTDTTTTTTLTQGLTLDKVEMRSSVLIFCARGLRDQGKNSYLPGMVFFVLRDHVAVRERDLLMTYVDDEQTDRADQPERDMMIAAYYQPNYHVPIIRINDDPRAALLGDLVKEYESLSLEAPSLSSSQGVQSALSPSPGSV